jgi:hypothetical protein
MPDGPAEQAANRRTTGIEVRTAAKDTVRDCDRRGAAAGRSSPRALHAATVGRRLA